MLSKPKHLGPEYAAQFTDKSVATAYRTRPPYPAETFEALTELMTDLDNAVLDAGCGTGDIGRNLAPLVQRVDAIDASAAMIEEGKLLPGGDRDNLRWIHAPIETAELHPPYGLIVTGESLHWMDWTTVIPRFRQALMRGRYLAIVNRSGPPVPWGPELMRIIPGYSTNKGYEPYSLIEELQKRKLYRKLGERHTQPVTFRQSVEDYVESFHSRNGFSRQRMSPEMASEFDDKVRKIIGIYYPDGVVEMQVFAVIEWGIPIP